MISLILPYWQRQGATDRSLELMARHYRELHMEVIVVDDGSPTPYAPPSGTPFPVRVIRLPAKTRPLDPCVLINVGANTEKPNARRNWPHRKSTSASLRPSSSPSSSRKSSSRKRQ